MLEVLLSAAAAFAATTIDDIFILMLFFAQSRNRRTTMQIITGQYLGIGILVVCSMLFAAVLQNLPAYIPALLGLFPLSFGIKGFLCLHKQSCSAPETVPTDENKPLTVQIALIALANGGDNLGVYIPLFASYTALQSIAALFIFAVALALWCLLAIKLSHLPSLRRLLEQTKRNAIPSVLTLLGLHIFIGGLFNL